MAGGGMDGDGGVEREEQYHIHQVHNVRVGYSERKGQGPLALNTSIFPTQSMHSLLPMITGILFFHLLLSCCKM